MSKIKNNFKVKWTSYIFSINSDDIPGKHSSPNLNIQTIFKTSNLIFYYLSIKRFLHSILLKLKGNFIFSDFEPKPIGILKIEPFLTQWHIYSEFLKKTADFLTNPRSLLWITFTAMAPFNCRYFMFRL